MFYKKQVQNIWEILLHMSYFKVKPIKSGQGCDASVHVCRIMGMDFEEEKQIVSAVNKVPHICT